MQSGHAWPRPRSPNTCSLPIKYHAQKHRLTNATVLLWNRGWQRVRTVIRNLFHARVATLHWNCEMLDLHDEWPLGKLLRPSLMSDRLPVHFRSSLMTPSGKHRSMKSGRGLPVERHIKNNNNGQRWCDMRNPLTDGQFEWIRQKTIQADRQTCRQTGLNEFQFVATE